MSIGISAINRKGEDVDSFGFQTSTFLEVINPALEALGVGLFDDPLDPEEMLVAILTKGVGNLIPHDEANTPAFYYKELGGFIGWLTNQADLGNRIQR